MKDNTRCATHVNLLPTKARFGFTLAEGATHVDMSPTKVRLGFTLAEVLITLGIIGVVAAMTIPNLIANYKAHRLSSQFLGSYSIIQQVFKQMESDEVSLSPSDYGVGQYYKTFMKYLQAPYDCGLGGSIGENNKNFKGKPCYNTSGRYSDVGYKTFDGSKTAANQALLDDGQIALQNGTLLMFENNALGVNSDRVYVSVDLNGYNNKPNRWGYDLFTFQLKDGELKTMGTIGTDYTDMNTYCSKNSSSAFNGITCAQKAKENPQEYFKYVVKTVK